MGASTTRQPDGAAASAKFRFLLTHRRRAQGFREALGTEADDATSLTMLWMPPGRFWMGSPEEEPGRSNAEGPQHLVQLQGFFLSQNPITQAQWREVAQWPPSKAGPASTCPLCDHTDSRVLEARAADHGGKVRRRRECLSCDFRFTTYEGWYFCPNCQYSDSQVLESRSVRENGSIRRRRKCLKCDFSFTTFEQQEGPNTSKFLNPNPYHFKGDQRPVEQVSWVDAMEFCRRLSQRTGRHYTLPSEAQWEYACRAGTTTPFHFGTTISMELSNYDGRDREVYVDEEKGEDRQQTIDVSSFPANHWGLHDMHGNVWEWCADHWHSNYEDAPEDGRAWSDEDVKENDDKMNFRLLRGGSWFNHSANCRSASRLFDHADSRNDFIGFRVCCLTQD